MRSREGQAVDAFLISRSGAPLRFAFSDQKGRMHEAAVVSTIRRAINIAQASDANTVFVADPPQITVQTGVDLAPQWTLAGEPTFFIRSKDDAGRGNTDFVLHNPLGGNSFAVSTGEEYSVSLLAAHHRCTATVRTIVRSRDERVLVERSVVVKPGTFGGQTEDGYEQVFFHLVIPEEAESVELWVTKSPTSEGEDSYVFLARPQIVRLGTSESDPLILEREALALYAAGLGEPAAYSIAIPASLIEAGAKSASLNVYDGDTAVRLGETSIEVRREWEIDNITCTEGMLRFTIPRPPAPSAKPPSVLIDGQRLSIATASAVSNEPLPPVGIPARFLDGKPHLVEVRAHGTDFPLLRDALIFPPCSTPWDALRTYSTPPFDPARDPAAPHHHRSLVAWLDVGEGERPPLSQLYSELNAGPRKRASYPPLKIQAPADPDVSIVVPVHNKFEMTYHCLVSIAFAYTALSYEIIVVDDGSSDTTSDIQDIVDGLRVVRHETAKGFVDACNAGASVATGRYVCFLNNDTQVTAYWLDELVRTFSDFEDVGLAGSKLVYPDGRLQEAGGIVWRTGNPWNVGRNGDPDAPAFNYARTVDYLSGASILIERDFWNDLGGFSEELAPAYFEDTDLAMKVRAAGRRAVYCPHSVVYHMEGGSAGTDTSSGMKRFQEVNRPKFKAKWTSIFSSHGVEGHRPDLEKDRGAAFRVLAVDYQIPMVDQDAGSYAAFQEIRLLQHLGGKVTFLPRNVAWMDRHVTALQRVGVEVLYAPYVSNYLDYIEKNAADFDVIYITRHWVAEEIIDLVRKTAPKTKIVLNLADLHFLRELREAKAGAPGYTEEGAFALREKELAVARKVDLILSYSDVECAVVHSHIGSHPPVMRAPWVLDHRGARTRVFDETEGLLFLGNFAHPPNAEAVKFLARQVMPGLAQRIPDVRLSVVGARVTPEVAALAGPNIDVVGFVDNLDEAFARARIFVAPLLAGAGIKGKVLEAMSQGSAMVLSSIAAEGTALSHGRSALVVDQPEQWVESLAQLYLDEAKWRSLTEGALEVAHSEYSFSKGAEMMRAALHAVDIFGGPGLTYRSARPPY